LDTAQLFHRWSARLVHRPCLYLGGKSVQVYDLSSVSFAFYKVEQYPQSSWGNYSMKKNRGQGREVLPWITVIPFVPHGVNIFQVVCPWIIFPCTIGMANGTAKNFVAALPPGFKRNRLIVLRLFQSNLLKEDYK